MTDYDKIEIAKNILEDLVKHLDVGAIVKYEESILKGLVFNISCPDSYLLIGKQGATLHSLQVLAQNLVTKKLKGEQFWFIVDVDDYKIKREWFLKETAKGAAVRVFKTGRPVKLEPMPSFERRFVHSYLQEHNPELFSESVGDEPWRKIIVRPK